MGKAYLAEFHDFFDGNKRKCAPERNPGRKFATKNSNGGKRVKENERDDGRGVDDEKEKEGGERERGGRVKVEKKRVRGGK